jgi:hypothetical protein
LPIPVKIIMVCNIVVNKRMSPPGWINGVALGRDAVPTRDARIAVLQIRGIPDEIFEGLSPEIDTAELKMAEYVKKGIMEG